MVVTFPGLDGGDISRFGMVVVIFLGLVGTTLEGEWGGGGREVTRREDGLVEGSRYSPVVMLFVVLRLIVIVIVIVVNWSSSLSPSLSLLSTRCSFTPTLRRPYREPSQRTKGLCKAVNVR